MAVLTLNVLWFEKRAQLTPGIDPLKLAHSIKTPFYGWWITASAFLVLFLAYGVQYSFGVFVPPMVQELGWSRASLGGAFSLYTVVYTGFSLLSGRLTDTWGPKRVIGLGGVLLGIGIMATSQISASWQLYLWYGVVAALGMSTAYIPCNITVVRWFHSKRGLALGIASCGASFGILLVPLLASLMIAQAGWRTAMLVLGGLLFVLINVIARIMVRSPEQLGLLPDGDSTPSESAGRSSTTPRDEGGSWTVREALGTFSFWMFLIAFAVTFLTLTVPFVHVPVFASDVGLSNVGGAKAVGMVGVFSLVGSFTLGPLSDRVGRKWAMTLGCGSQVLAYLIFLSADGAIALYVGAAAFGFFYGGTASLFPALVGDLFGRAHAGTIGGIVFGGAGMLGAWGPTIAGYLRDSDGDYRFAFTSCAVTATCALLLFALLPQPRRPKRSPST